MERKIGVENRRKKNGVNLWLWFLEHVSWAWNNGKHWIYWSVKYRSRLCQCLNTVNSGFNTDYLPRLNAPPQSNKHQKSSFNGQTKLSLTVDQTPVSVDIAQNEWHNYVCTWNVYHNDHNKTVCSLSEPDDEISVQLLYRNALDIHCKHTASHLHDVEGNVPSDYHV